MTAPATALTRGSTGLRSGSMGDSDADREPTKHEEAAVPPPAAEREPANSDATEEGKEAQAVRDQAEWEELVADEWLTRPEVIKRLGISRQTLIEITAQGRLRAYQPHHHIRYRRSDVLAYLRSVEWHPPPTEE